MSFNVTLPSNASSNLYPENKQTLYRTKLSTPLHLPGKWSVAITEIFLPRSWWNVDASNDSFKLALVKSVPPGKDKSDFESKLMKIPEGHYHDIGLVINSINTLIHSLDKDVKFAHNDFNNRISISSSSTKAAVKLSPGLSSMLGFDASKSDTWLPAEPDAFSAMPPWPVFAKYAPDVSGGISSAYIYSDIIEHQHVGDVTAQLLRAVPITYSGTETLHYIFEKPDYIPVIRDRVDTILIDIRTDFGEHFVFEMGKVIVRLHFRRDS